MTTLNHNHYEEAQGWSDRALQTSTEIARALNLNLNQYEALNSPEDVQAALDRVNEEPIVHVEDVFHLAYLWHCQQETIEGLYQLLMADIVEDEDPCL